jgi:hypothetical protein
MGAVTSTSTFKEITPGQNAKCVLCYTPTTSDGGDTVDFAGYVKTIRAVFIQCGDGSTATASATWSSTTVTIPSTATQNKTYSIIVWGTD